MSDRLIDSLQWSREAIAAGEWWRLLTGHCVHLDLAHACLNIAALLLLWRLFGRVFALRHLLAIVLLGIAAIDAGLWWLSEIDWYVGLSGLLHAWAAATVVRLLIDHDRQYAIAWIVAIFGLGKIVQENLWGALPLSTNTAAVVTDAHLFGVLAGMVMGLILPAVRN
ncbi:MAG: rhombosortase [Gammaproteobacteria bacterium]|jgi:rhomboid family GlyGly-CTERM serine protease|nr:rhombosortase [Gammaproteobacteria bacterium]MBM4224635.1 rhombosortase [Gammaproteobacteria bacterium]MBM4230059.1 rhombosortase [Gammaproteobacteria bacterium]